MKKAYNEFLFPSAEKELHHKLDSEARECIALVRDSIHCDVRARLFFVGVEGEGGKRRHDVVERRRVVRIRIGYSEGKGRGIIWGNLREAIFHFFFQCVNQSYTQRGIPVVSNVATASLRSGGWKACFYVSAVYVIAIFAGRRYMESRPKFNLRLFSNNRATSFWIIKQRV